MEQNNVNALPKAEKEYGKIMEGFNSAIVPDTQSKQWKKENDFFTKFSLYDETPSSIASTNTIATL